MTDLEQYVRDAVRTESVIEKVDTNTELLMGTLEALIALGNILDMVKKNVFYGKPIDLEELQRRWLAASVGMTRFSVMEANESTDVILSNELDTRMFHSIVGVATESTELLEALLVKLQGGDFDFVNVCEEFGDLNWYEAIAVDTMEADFDRVLSVNIDKLRARFPDKYTDEKAINRDLDTERDILEEG